MWTLYSLWAKPYGMTQLRVSIALVAMTCFALTLLTVVIAVIWQLFKKRWRKASSMAIALLFLFIEVYFALGLFFGMFMVIGGDNFAENLTIPENIEISQPIGQNTKAGDEKDPLQLAVMTALSQSANDSTLSDQTDVTANVSSLLTLQKESPDVLRYYLAASPAWFLSEHDDRTTAIRRWKINSEWQYSDDERSIDFLPQAQSDSPSLNSFQLEIDFSMKENKHSGSTVISPGETKTVDVSSSEQSYFSSYIVKIEDFFLKIKESSTMRNRIATQTAISFIENELVPLATNPTRAKARELIAENETQIISPSIELKRLSESGIYQLSSWINSGEAGSVYIKAFEVTREAPLSERSRRMITREQVGWSNDPSELFLTNRNIIIGEGEPSELYAARFELWFEPDSGEGDRKLSERVFAIEGLAEARN